MGLSADSCEDCGVAFVYDRMENRGIVDGRSVYPSYYKCPNCGRERIHGLER
jgi:hypothetical protein